MHIRWLARGAVMACAVAVATFAAAVPARASITVSVNPGNV